jgi:hypothetical protein
LLLLAPVWDNDDPSSDEFGNDFDDQDDADGVLLGCRTMSACG